MTAESSDATRAVRLSGPTMWSVAAATNEASIFDEQSRRRVGAPSNDLSELIAASCHEVLGGMTETVTWTVPISWLDDLARVIPQVLAAVERKELFIRSDRWPEDFAAAQVELLGALREAGWSPPT